MRQLKIDFDSIKPIYMQIAEAIEDEIIVGNLAEGSPVYSQLILSRELGVNPATAAKGLSALVQSRILEKQRGQSMAVAAGAKSKLLADRRANGFRAAVRGLVDEARKLELPEERLIAMVHEYFTSGEGGSGNG